MEINSIVSNKLQQATDLKVGDKLQVNVVKADGNGGYTMSAGGKLLEGFSTSSLTLGAQRVVIVSIDPRIEVSPLNSNKDAGLQTGAKVAAEIISLKGDLYSLTIGGKTFTASIIPAPGAAKFIGEIIKTDPLLELKPIFVSLKDITASFMAREMASFNQKDLSSIMKMFSGASLGAFLPDEIRRIVKDGGNFFENKLSRGISPSGDVKTATYVEGNDGARENVTKMQIANILMQDDFFSFFEGDDLDFEGGVMRFCRNEEGDLNLYVKLDFTNLGDTVVSFTKSLAKGYYITVRTDADISEALSQVSVEGCQINWRKLKKCDKDFFNIKKESFTGLQGLDIKI